MNRAGVAAALAGDAGVEGGSGGGADEDGATGSSGERQGWDEWVTGRVGFMLTVRLTHLTLRVLQVLPLQTPTLRRCLTHLLPTCWGRWDAWGRKSCRLGVMTIDEVDKRNRAEP